MYGWFGKLLRVSLKDGVITEEKINEDVLAQWIGGRGLGVRIIAKEVPVHSNPLGFDNKLIFAVGPLAGTKVPTTSRFSASAKSPLTGTILDSNSGGIWGVRFKKCGYDAVIIEGSSSVPVYLAISMGRVIIEDAQELWGLDVQETNKRIKAKYGNKCSISCIGPAGENLVKFASIMNDGDRALGRGGLGAVMGSKKLKAIVVDGSKDVEVANIDRLDFMVYEAEKWIKANPITSKGLPEFGTPVLVNLYNEMGVFPVRNFQESQFSDAKSISGEFIAENITLGRKGCYRCPIQCSRVIKTKNGKAEGPEYESIWALGPECGIGDLGTIVEANLLCNRLGLDTISTGVTIGCAMELEEKGLIQTGLRFGDAEGLLKAIVKIAYRDDFGDLLAEGSLNLAQNCGAPNYAMHVKGLELPAYDPRGLQGMGLGFATSNRGGCHMRAYMTGPEALGVPKMVDRFTTEGKAGLTITQQNMNAAIDSLIFCRFVSLAVTEEYFARILSSVTGVDYQPQDLYKIGERIWNLERVFNIKAGLDSSHDTLPPRLLEEPISDGPSRGKIVDLKPMISEYYRFRGWDVSGVPSEKKLTELGLVGFDVK